MRADKLLHQGDMDGVAVWKRILRAVDELLAGERPEAKQMCADKGGREWRCGQDVRLSN